MTVMTFQQLDPNKIVDTVQVLHQRIQERFPGAGLTSVSEKLLEIARRTRVQAHEISRPILWIRLLSGLIIAAIIGASIVTVWLAMNVEVDGNDVSAVDVVQVIEAGINDVLLIGATIFFLVTLETRVKRRRALRALHELRAMAHIIDMHQLTKDPDRLLRNGPDTKSSPTRRMSQFELSRYLDYCSEMLSLLGKIAALYVQEFEDSDAVSAVNEVESLTNGMSRKIWQKLVVLDSIASRTASKPSAPA